MLLVLAAGCAAHPPARPGGSAAAPRPALATGKAARELQRDLGLVFNAPIMAHAQWAVAVRSADSGEVLYELNPRKLMVPASNMKILTLAGAAHVLGWDGRFTTTLEVSGRVEGGALHGDLYVRGGGDPTINTREGRAAAVFDAWAAALRSAGIHEVKGRIVGDDQRFDEDGVGGGWAWDYLQYGYAAPVGALQYDENAAPLTILPGAAPGEPALVALPAGTGLSVLNRALTGPPGSAVTIDYRRHPDRPVLEVTGLVPLAPPGGPAATPAPAVVRRVAVVNPTVYFVQSLREGLAARGVPVRGGAADFDDIAAELAADPPERRVLVTTESPPLGEIASVLMKASQNLYAETLLKAAGAATGGLGTVPAGRAAVLSALRTWGLDERSIVMADGSGLSRYNYVTAELLASVLERMYTDGRHRAAFLASLPLAGRDGTLAARMRRTPAEGNARAKTGSISNMRALSGYVRSRDGEMLIFALLANDFVIPAARVNRMADLAVEILANFSRR